MKAKIKIQLHDLIEAIMASNPEMQPKNVRKYIVETLVMDEDGYIELDLTFQKPIQGNNGQS